MARKDGDRFRLMEMKPVRVTAEGEIDGKSVKWARKINEAGVRTSNADAHEALGIINKVFRRDKESHDVLVPILAYYGAGRSWLPSRDRGTKSSHTKAVRRWDAFYDCFSERIRQPDLYPWFERELLAKASEGTWRPGFLAVKKAILDCIPNADEMEIDPDRKEILVSINGNSQPYLNLSAGQRMMFALVADIAIKAVTQNAHLLPDSTDNGSS